MESLGSGTTNSEPIPTNIQEKAEVYEDEINLIDYFVVIRKHKFLVLLGSVLPALIVGLILFFSPRDYKIIYTYDVKDQSTYDVRDRSIYDVRDRSIYDARDRNIYDPRDQSIYDVKDQSIYDVSNWNLDEKNYNVLLNRFYSAGNIDKIINKLRENGLDKYANRIQTAEPKDFVEFTVLPPYMDLSKVTVTDPATLENIRQLKALLLNMAIIARPKNDISKISLVIRDNLENVIPVYMVEEQLGTATRRLRAEIANIEENSFDLKLALKTKKAIVGKLKKIDPGTSDKKESSIALQFDISGKTEFLPVEYQIQATESETVQLEEQIAANEERCKYHKDLLTLNEDLFAELRSKAPFYYTIQQFYSFLTDLAKNYEDRALENGALKDYLNSYIKRIKNRISVSAPVTQKPKVHAVSKGTVQKTAIAFVVLLMVTTFAAFLLEGVQKNRAQTT
jgi:hypothetical protein